MKPTISFSAQEELCRLHEAIVRANEAVRKSNRCEDWAEARSLSAKLSEFLGSLGHTDVGRADANHKVD